MCRRFTGLIGVGAVLTGCAVGPTLNEKLAQLPALTPEKARLHIYRPAQFWESMIQPSILVDDAHIGDAVPGGVRVLDLPPGLHCVTVEKSPLVPGSGSPTRCEELRGGSSYYLRVELGSRDVPSARYYREEWRNGAKVRVYESFVETGPCQWRAGLLCEPRTVTQYFNDARYVDSATGEREARELVLLEAAAKAP